METIYDSDNTANTVESDFQLSDNEKGQNTMNKFEDNLTIGDFGKNLVVNDIEFHLELQEYPRTSEDGVAYVYSVSAFDHKKAREFFSLKNIQYAMDSKSGTAYEFECGFLGIKAMKNMRKCHGVKMCSHSAEELNSSHDSVNFETNTYKNIYNTYEHSIEKYTINFFVVCSKTSCQFINCNGSPKLSEGSSTKYFIGCNGWKSGESHRYLRIPLNVNIERLKELFQNYNFYANSTEEDSTSNTALDSCYTVLPYNSKNKKCYFPHKFSNNTVTDGGLIIHKPCQVRFYCITPLDLEKCPYIVIISKGVHAHPPPPPVKIPINLVEDLQSIMNDENLSNLTARKFLTKPTLLTYLNGLSLNSIHPSLNNQSKVNYLIAKEKRSKHPHGQNILGTVHEFMKNKDLNDAYIRKIEFFQILVLCMRKEQSFALLDLSYFEIDMAYKRIQGEIKEWDLVAYVENFQKTLTFARVFTNNKSADAYQNIFAAVFSVVKEDTNSEICFHHIDGKGIGCILADAHPGQALGISLLIYLNNRYPYLSAIEHLKHIYKICLIHFNRNIRQKSEIPTEIKKMMYAIPHLETKAEVLNVLEQIKLIQNKQAIDWVNDKSNITKLN
ncbi:hypothetical protein RhiirA4_546495 [Rhizophagus irregularis]|uniref:Uncharacterized protein n=1 Tax=Rhizophagus irregularis TaxID=588596 RepID=A0A2I1GXG1_9GLOM|nr:hypothetical protein RhiirA4_546495 [Rhizophagus irregularis]